MQFIYANNPKVLYKTVLYKTIIMFINWLQILRVMDENRKDNSEEVITRVKLPRGSEVFGVLDQRLGGSRMRVRCLDGKNRICRIPGRMKRSLWVREGDVLLIRPWEHGGDEKGDVIYKYRPIQVNWLRDKGYLRKLDEFEEF